MIDHTATPPLKVTAFGGGVAWRVDCECGWEGDAQENVGASVNDHAMHALVALREEADEDDEAH